jgi:hypothetical protein
MARLRTPENFRQAEEIEELRQRLDDLDKGFGELKIQVPSFAKVTDVETLQEHVKGLKEQVNIHELIDSIIERKIVRITESFEKSDYFKEALEIYLNQTNEMWTTQQREQDQSIEDTNIYIQQIKKDLIEKEDGFRKKIEAASKYVTKDSCRQEHLYKTIQEILKMLKPGGVEPE